MVVKSTPWIFVKSVRCRASADKGDDTLEGNSGDDGCGTTDDLAGAEARRSSGCVDVDGFVGSSSMMFSASSRLRISSSGVFFVVSTPQKPCLFSNRKPTRRASKEMDRGWARRYSIEEDE